MTDSSPGYDGEGVLSAVERFDPAARGGSAERVQGSRTNSLPVHPKKMEATSILGLYSDNGKDHGSYYLGFRVLGFQCRGLLVVSIITAGGADY